MSHPSITESVESPSFGRTVAPAKYLSPLTAFGPEDGDDDDDDFGDGLELSRVRLDRLPQPEPTQARPGSVAKVDEMARRYEAGLDLWHGDDPKAFAGDME